MRRKFVPFINRTYTHVFGITCTSEILPPVEFDYCEPEIRLSEIRRIFITKKNAIHFNDWTRPEEWNERINQNSMDINVIRPFIVIGDKPLPTSIKKAISFQRNKIMRKDHLINATIDEVSEKNHEFIKSLKDGKPYTMWYEIWGGLMFGGNGGIDITLFGEMVLPRGNASIMAYLLTAVWTNPRTEDRCESPIFDLDNTPLLSEDGVRLQSEDGNTLYAEHY